MERFERSCGVVIYHDDAPNGRQYLLLHYPTGHWDFAKGHVERDEDHLTTALREAREETGLDELEILSGFRHEFEYGYRHRDTPIRKRVHWFLGRSAHTSVRLSHEHQGFAWLPYPAALERVTYENAKELLRQAEAYLARARGA